MYEITLYSTAFAADVVSIYYIRLANTSILPIKTYHIKKNSNRRIRPTYVGLTSVQGIWPTIISRQLKIFSAYPGIAKVLQYLDAFPGSGGLSTLFR